MCECDSIRHHIFYHDASLLTDDITSLDPNLFRLIDLNALPIPRELQLEELTEQFNRALFSEYLGILSIQVETEFVGCFTYSIPRKFSPQWALETGAHRTFLPQIRFSDLLRASFKPGVVYAPEFKNPLDNAYEFITKLHRTLPAGESILPGPYKGSFIVQGREFREFQVWFLRAANLLLESVDYKALTPTYSLYDHGSLAQQSEERKTINAIRHTYGDLLERAVAYYWGARFDNDSKIKLGLYLRQNTIIQDALLAEAHRRHRNHEIIVVFSDAKYRMVTMRWVRQAVSVGVNHYIIVSLDEKSTLFFRQNDVPCILRPFDSTQTSLWIFRTRIIKELLDSGLSVIQSDADAFLFQSPFPLLDRVGQYDIVSSIGTTYPKSAWEIMGFVLCCGFIRFNPTPALLAFFDLFIARCEEAPEDQVALNELLVEQGLHVVGSPCETVMYYNNLAVRSFEHVVTCATRTLSVAILPHKLFQRLPDPVTQPVVAHHLSPKDHGSKITTFEHAANKMSRSAKLQESGLVWLASYPRSGNTLLRIMLNNNFGLKSASIYNDVKDIGKIKEVADVVGHINLDLSQLKLHRQHWPAHGSGIDPLRKGEGHQLLVKTHAPYHKDFSCDKSIYVCRDGRAALRSHASYIKNFSIDMRDPSAILRQLIVCGDHFAGYWTDHVLNWNQRHEDGVLFIKFEDMVTTPQRTLQSISDFLEVPIQNEDVISFEELHALCPTFFRRGKKDLDSDCFDTYSHVLYWMFNTRAMVALEYERDINTLEKMVEIFRTYSGVFDQDSDIDIAKYILVRCSIVISSLMNDFHAYNRGAFTGHISGVVQEFIDYFAAHNVYENDDWLPLYTKLIC